jgi:hypothetical protein
VAESGCEAPRRGRDAEGLRPTAAEPDASDRGKVVASEQPGPKAVARGADPVNDGPHPPPGLTGARAKL